MGSGSDPGKQEDASEQIVVGFKRKHWLHDDQCVVSAAIPERAFMRDILGGTPPEA